MFTQTYYFEPTLVAFDKPFEELIYMEPTPRPGREGEPDYYNEGDIVGHVGGFKTGTEVVCGPGVELVDGQPTGWLWVPPDVNSLGEPYGGCRQDFACRLNVPEREEIFGPSGLPTEDDYECLDYDHDSE